MIILEALGVLLFILLFPLLAAIQDREHERKTGRKSPIKGIW